jgi:hypothetical protein
MNFSRPMASASQDDLIEVVAAPNGVGLSKPRMTTVIEFNRQRVNRRV